jgi:hypothetical protein
LKSSARSALTEGSDSLTLVLVHPEVNLGYRSHARSVQAKESLSCESEQSIEGLLLQVCVESKELNTWKCSRISTRSACKGLLEDSELCEAQEGQGFQARRREAQRVYVMECLDRCYKVTHRRTSFHKGILGSPIENIKEEEIDGYDLEEKICKIPPAVGSAKEARRLRPCSEFKLQGS